MLSLKKQSSYSWERSGLRKIQFDALKKGEKVGFQLGGEGQRTEIVSVKDGTQSYWKGVKKGYRIVSVNGTKVDAITVRTAVKEALCSGSGFTVGMSTGEPKDDEKKSSKSKPSRTKAKTKAAPKVSKKPKVAVDDSKEEIVVVQGYNDEKPIVDNGEFFYQDEVDIGGWFAGDDQGSDYVPIEKR